jgi:hypothetical protein
MGYLANWSASVVQEEDHGTYSVNQSDFHRKIPWNKRKMTGAKPPLRTKHVWSIRSQLQAEGRIRDLALFNIVIDSKLRGSTFLTRNDNNMNAAPDERKLTR